MQFRSDSGWCLNPAGMQEHLVAADPHAWPFRRSLMPGNTALLVIDMQRGLYGPGGSRSPVLQAVDPLRHVLGAMRAEGFRILFTREGLSPDDRRIPVIGETIDDGGERRGWNTPVWGTAGWEILPELAPERTETVIDKPGKGAFFDSELGPALDRLRVSNLILTGDACVHPILAQARDHGFECLVLEDCCTGLSPAQHLAAMTRIRLANSASAAVSTSAALLAALG